MLEIGALSDLRSYLSGQETVRVVQVPNYCMIFIECLKALKEILIEELHAHLYLKAFWCESRWAAYTPGQQTCMLYRRGFRRIY